MGCGSDASAAALKGSVTYGKTGGIAGVVQNLTVRPDGRAVAASATPQAIVQAVQGALTALTKAVKAADLAHTKSPKDNVQGADGFSFGVGYDSHRVTWSDFSDDPPKRVLGCIACSTTLYEQPPRPLLLIDVDGVLSLFGTRRRAGADRRHPAPALARGRGDAAHAYGRLRVRLVHGLGGPGRRAPAAPARPAARVAARDVLRPRAATRTGSSPGSTPTRETSARSRGSTTATTTPAGRGPRHAAAPPCSSRPILGSACSRSTRTCSGSGRFELRSRRRQRERQRLAVGCRCAGRPCG